MDGILIVDKPQGITSHDVVDFMRKRFGLKKVGHAGTLDPMATGVLVMLIGRYTRSSSTFMNADKEYEGTMTLGGRSDTGDADGTITKSNASLNFDRGAIEAAFKKFRGEIEQVPPSFSAIKYKGKKMYELARKGTAPSLPPRKVHIKELEVLIVSIPEVSFRALCSKGTYVRALASGIGEALGCGAYLSRLRRTRSGSFHIDKAVALDSLKQMEISELEKRLYRS